MVVICIRRSTSRVYRFGIVFIIFWGVFLIVEISVSRYILFDIGFVVRVRYLLVFGDVGR